MIPLEISGALLSPDLSRGSRIVHASSCSILSISSSIGELLMKSLYIFRSQGFSSSGSNPFSGIGSSVPDAARNYSCSFLERIDPCEYSLFPILSCPRKCEHGFLDSRPRVVPRIFFLSEEIDLPVDRGAVGIPINRQEF